MQGETPKRKAEGTGGTQDTGNAKEPGDKRRRIGKMELSFDLHVSASSFRAPPPPPPWYGPPSLGLGAWAPELRSCK